MQQTDHELAGQLQAELVEWRCAVLQRHSREPRVWLRGAANLLHAGSVTTGDSVGESGNSLHSPKFS